MAIIDPHAQVVTLINIFTCRKDDQQRLADLLIEATNQTMKRMPGFVSASIHRSFDGTRVVNYAQWRSREDFAAMRENPEARPHMAAAAALATFEPILCEVADSIAVGG